MRIGIVSAEYPPAVGGVGDHAARLAAELTRLGQTVQVLTTGHERADRLAPTEGPPVFRSISRWDWRLLGQVRRMAYRQAWDLVHIQYQPAAYDLHGAVTLLPWWLKRARQPVTVITTFHDLRVPYLFPKAGPLREAAVRQLARGSDGAIAVAEEDRSTLVKWAVRPGSSTVVELIPLGNHFDAPPPADFDRDAWRASAGAAPHTFLLGHVGLINRSKGVDHLLRALADVRADGADARLLMIGDTLGASDSTNATYLAEVRRLAHDLDVECALHWTGYEPVDRVAGWLRCLDLVVLPFIDRPTLRRTSLIAAWSHDVPVLTTEPAIRADWLREGDLHSPTPGPAAVTVAEPDATLLAVAIRELAHDPERREALAAAGQTYARRFAWPAVASQTLALYRAAHRRRVADA
jgi:glycosyltransferase involved in cell wall biosynthesis